MYRTVAMYRCVVGHTETREVLPGRAPAPEIECVTCARQVSQANKRGRPAPKTSPLRFQGERRVKTSAAQLRG